MSTSLYERLGGGERIAAIIDEAIDLHLKNPLLAPRFQKADTGRLEPLGHELFRAGAGGPERYSGRDMRAAHSGMNISEQELPVAVDDIGAAMDAHGVRVERVEATAPCDTDSRGRLGMDGAVPDLEDVQLHIRIRSPESGDRLERLYWTWQARCPISPALLDPVPVRATLEVEQG